MLMIKRCPGEAVVLTIGDVQILVSVAHRNGNQVALGFHAPKEKVKISRAEFDRDGHAMLLANGLKRELRD